LFYNWGPSFIEKNFKGEFGNNAQFTTASITIYGLSSFSARMIAAFIPSKRTIYFMKFVSCCSLILACVTLYCFSGIYAFYLTAGLVGFATGPLWPSTSGLVTDHVPAANVSYYLVIGLVGFAGYALAPLVTGLLAEQSGNINTGFFVFIPLMAAALLVAVWKLRSLAKENGSYYR
jgi:MFS family permease